MTRRAKPSLRGRAGQAHTLVARNSLQTPQTLTQKSKVLSTHSVNIQPPTPLEDLNLSAVKDSLELNNAPNIVEPLAPRLLSEPQSDTTYASKNETSWLPADLGNHENGGTRDGTSTPGKEHWSGRFEIVDGYAVGSLEGVRQDNVTIDVTIVDQYDRRAGSERLNIAPRQPTSPPSTHFFRIAIVILVFVDKS